VGAWIETVLILKGDTIREVAPCVGAWIETQIMEVAAKLIMSHPAWVHIPEHTRSLSGSLLGYKTIP
jgi:hypothetical protein